MKSYSRTNWSGNHLFKAATLHEPLSVSAVQDIVSKAVSVRGIGCRHSFTGIADTRGDQISLVNLNQLNLNTETGSVVIGGGVTYAQLGKWLHQQGYALPNLASFSNMTVAGAVQTGTHGSGLTAGVLATSVLSMDMVAANGELVHIGRDNQGDNFFGTVVGLGLLGIVVSLELQVEPTYSVSQRVFERMPFASLQENLREVFTSADSVSCFLTWDHDVVPQTWIKSRVDTCRQREAVHLMHMIGAQEARENRSFVDNRTSEDFTPQLGVPGPWYERLPHFTVGAIPSHGHELQSEYFIAFEYGSQALEAVARLREHIQPLLQVSEIRAVRADELWLSPAYQRELLALEFTWSPDLVRIERILPLLEETLSPFAARPHWAKIFSMRPKSALSLYEKASAFRELRASVDPDGKFLNEAFMEF